LVFPKPGADHVAPGKYTKLGVLEHDMTKFFF
jgi:hypothetical protein